MSTEEESPRVSVEYPSVCDDIENQALEDLARELIASTGENPSRSGIQKTPQRFARAMSFLTKGYRESLEEIINGAIFDVEKESSGIVIVRDIPIFSLCEHHLLPFHGTCHIGYIPTGKVLGLSKLARIAELYARRLQIQERLGQQIGDAIATAVEALGVAVIINASHMCMTMRGVEKPGAVTSTSYFCGEFKAEHSKRSEFLSLLHQK